MSLPSYRQYKNSGVEWLGTIPTHWHVDRFKASIVSCRNGIWGSEATGDTNDIACVRVADFDRTTLAVKSEIPTVRNVSQSERAERLLTVGNLLLEKSGGGENQPVGQVVIYKLDIPAVCSNFVAKMELAPEMFPAYWNYVHAAAYSVRLNVGSINQTSGIQNLDQTRYFDERAPFPPIDEQQAIAAFLDHETSKIDVLIAEQEKLLELLAEKRQTTISHTVTCGLNPNVPLKDSGVEWLGAVPAHWEVVGLTKYLDSIVDYRGRTPTKVDNGVFLVTAKNIRSGAIDYEASQEYIDIAEYDEVMRRGRPLKGDVLFTTEAPLGQVAIVDREDIALAQRIIKFRPAPRHLDSGYLKVWIMGSACQFNLELLATGSTALGIKGSKVGQVRLCLPPLEEQQEIVRHINIELRDHFKKTPRGLLTFSASC